MTLDDGIHLAMQAFASIETWLRWIFWSVVACGVGDVLILAVIWRRK